MFHLLSSLILILWYMNLMNNGQMDRGNENPTQHLPWWLWKTTKKTTARLVAPGFEPETSRMRVSCVTRAEPPRSVNRLFLNEPLRTYLSCAFRIWVCQYFFGPLYVYCSEFNIYTINTLRLLICNGTDKRQMLDLSAAQSYLIHRHTRDYLIIHTHVLPSFTSRTIFYNKYLYKPLPYFRLFP